MQQLAALQAPPTPRCCAGAWAAAASVPALAACLRQLCEEVFFWPEARATQPPQQVGQVLPLKLAQQAGALAAEAHNPAGRAREGQAGRQWDAGTVKAPVGQADV